MRGYNPKDNPDTIIDYINPETGELLEMRVSHLFADRYIEALQGCRFRAGKKAAL